MGHGDRSLVPVFTRETLSLEEYYSHPLMKNELM